MTKRWKGPDGREGWLELQRLMRFLGEDPEKEPPVALDEKLHEIFLRVLLEAKPCWAIFVICDILGLNIRFNRPGAAGGDNWSQRLDRPLKDYAQDPVIGPKLRFLKEAVAKTGRMPI
jgi:4-alpha-glucanotransferase